MSKSLKKLIDINRLREFKNKLVGTGSAYVQTGAVNQTIAGTKTFSKPIAGSVTGSSGSCTGNAATATQFSANATVALTGDATGTSAGSKKGWSVPVTLANSGVTAGSYGPTADVTGNNNATISVPQITVDAKGRVTSVTNRTLTCKNNTYNVYNKTLTIQKNGTKVATFTSNSNTDVTANITVPTKTSELTNDSGFLTSHQSLSNYVTLNGAQTISAVKTFTAKPVLNQVGLDMTVKDTTEGSTTTRTNQVLHANSSNSQYGINIAFCSGGNAVVGGGEAGTAQLDALAGNSGEDLYLVADGNIYLKPNGNTWADAKTITLNTAGEFSGLAKVTATSFVGALTGNVTGNCSGSSGSCTGNAATATTATTAEACTGNAASATKLATARTINGTAFNGTANITTANWGTARNISITDGTNTSTAVSVNGSANVSLNLPATIKAAFVGNITGNVTGNCSGSSGSCTGNAATATKLAAKRTIALSGAATGTATSFDGSGNITIPVTALASSAIRAQWYAAYPDGAEAHNAMWGGRDITAAFNNGTVSANIANGTFKDIFPGDYITKQVTISGTAYTVKWVIADCDYWWHKGDQNNGMETHHVVIVPQAPIFSANMNDTNTTEGGYKGSEMFQSIIPACATGIVNAFGASHILTFMDAITNSVDTSHASSGFPQFVGTPGWWGEWVSVQCNLMSEKMVFGAPICAAGAMDNMIATRQMSAFRLSERLINYNRQWWWLRDVGSSATFASVVNTGHAYAVSASESRGVRPFALLK